MNREQRKETLTKIKTSNKSKEMHRHYSGSGSAQGQNNGRPCVSKQFKIDNDFKN